MRLQTIQIVAALVAAIAFVLAFIAAGAILLSFAASAWSARRPLAWLAYSDRQPAGCRIAVIAM